MRRLLRTAGVLVLALHATPAWAQPAPEPPPPPPDDTVDDAPPPPPPDGAPDTWGTGAPTSPPPAPPRVPPPDEVAASADVSGAGRPLSRTEPVVRYTLEAIEVRGNRRTRSRV
ncbi:MAG: hypothetical protein KC776_17115, partial [Myxococcales bacterium]|nr:hypothetical protein [Myxococcales bacterium]